MKTKGFQGATARRRNQCNAPTQVSMALRDLHIAARKCSNRVQELGSGLVSHSTVAAQT